MALYVYWFLLALILVGLELATGTFYLLIVALGLTIGGIFALLGIAFWGQLALAGLAGILGIFLLQHLKRKHSLETKIQSLDIGQAVEVLTWKDDGTARVFYRGAEWNAELASQDIEHARILYINDIRGSVLVLTNRKLN